MTNNKTQSGQSTREIRQQEQGVPRAKRSGDQHGGEEAKGDHQQGGKNNEQSRHTDRGKGL